MQNVKQLSKTTFTLNNCKFKPPGENILYLLFPRQWNTQCLPPVKSTKPVVVTAMGTDVLILPTHVRLICEKTKRWLMKINSGIFIRVFFF